MDDFLNHLFHSGNTAVLTAILRWLFYVHAYLMLLFSPSTVSDGLLLQQERYCSSLRWDCHALLVSSLEPLITRQREN